ncbi:MAG TPA: pitrilysin family protein [Candidatus Solibacter sp.]
MLRRCALALLLPFLALAQLTDLAVDRSTLPNGLDLLLHTDRKAPIVHVNIRIRVGSKHERAGQFGMAHLTEHLVYQDRDGTPFSTGVERLGATNGCGDLTEDFTQFCETVPASALERLLWMESNHFAQFLPQNLTQKNLDRQREVVMNERRQKLENEAYHRIHPVLHEQAFPPGHPYNHEAVGEYADLRSITLDDVRAFYAAHYTPDQMSIAIVGDFDPAETKRWVAKYFGPLAPADVLALPLRSAPLLAAPKFVQLGERVREERVHFVWVGPPAVSRDAAALEFAAFMLGDDYSPRNLHKTLTDHLSQGISIDYDQYQDASLFYPFVTVTRGASIAAIDEKLAAELARLGREGPSAAEMTRTFDHLESDHLNDLESISGMASTMQQVHHFYGGIDHWRDWVGRYNSVTAGDVRAAVNRWLVVPSHLTVDVLPITAVHGDMPEPDRSAPPALQPEKPYHPPEIQSAKLPNGLQIFLLERHDLPKVSVRIQFRAGAIQSPPDKPAVMLLAAATAGKDNKTADGVDIERAFSDLGANVYGDADLNGQDFGLTVLRKNLDAAFRIAAASYLHPVYPEWAIEARKKVWLQEIEHPDNDLGNFARELFAAAFGVDHLLGRGLGNADSIRSLTAADARTFHDRYWKPDVAALVFAGDITLKDAVALATETLGGWTGTAPAAPAMPPPAPKHDRIVFVDRKGATQTMVVQVLPGIPRDHPDYPALFLADRIYGGISSNRIWENIRGQHSIAYYARSELNTLAGAGMWLVLSPVQQDATALAMREFEKELAAFGRTKPITQTELDQARTGIIRSLPEQFETLGSAAGTIGWNWAQGLPVSNLQAFATRLAAVTLDEVNTVARKYARPDQAFFLLVGDREKITPQLRDFR